LNSIKKIKLKNLCVINKKLQKKNDRNKKGKKKFNFLKILMIVNIIRNIDFFRVRYTLNLENSPTFATKYSILITLYIIALVVYSIY